MSVKSFRNKHAETERRRMIVREEVDEREQGKEKKRERVCVCECVCGCVCVRARVRACALCMLVMNVMGVWCTTGHQPPALPLSGACC